MGMFKKIIGTGSKIIGVGSNKNDVKIAKIELEKAKIEEKMQKEKIYVEKEKNGEQEKEPLVGGYLEFIKNNFDTIQNVILSLKSDIEMSIAKIHGVEGAKLTLKEKGQLKKEKSSCQEKLKYLYLSKDFLVYLSKYASGIDLNKEQSSLIVKFAMYFDGVQVIEIEEYGDEDDDDSLIGAFKEITNEFKGVFYKPKTSSNTSEFYFSEYLDKYYDKKISQFEIPEVASVIEMFKKSIAATNRNDKLSKDQNVYSRDSNECPNCHAKVSANVKFCSECGSKIDIVQTVICEECHSTLEAGTKFCPNCGIKVSEN